MVQALRMILIGVLLFLALPRSSLSESILESGPSEGSLGSVSFFLDKKNPTTSSESIHIGEGDKAFFCVTLNAKDPRLEYPLKYLRQIEITLEGEGESPQKIIGKTKKSHKPVFPDAQGCYVGKLRVPLAIPTGKYKINELDLWLTSNDSVSLRGKLGNFSPLGLVEIESPHADQTPPLIEKIESRSPLEKRLRFWGNRGWARINFRVIATDLISGIKPESFRIFFKAYLDEVRVDILEPKCKTPLSNLYYDCTLYFSRAEPDLKGRNLLLVLDSISLTDKLGNDIELTQPSELEPLFGGELLRYTFYSGTSPYSDSSESKPAGTIKLPKKRLMNKKRL